MNDKMSQNDLVLSQSGRSGTKILPVRLKWEKREDKDQEEESQEKPCNCSKHVPQDRC